MKKIMSIVMTILFGSLVTITSCFLYGLLYLICTDHDGDGISDFDKMGCDTVLLLNPFDDYIRDIRVKGLQYNHEYEKASYDYSWFIFKGSLFSRVPSDQIASRYMQRAVVRYRLGDKSGAIEDYQLALRMNPTAENTIVYVNGYGNIYDFNAAEDTVAFWNYIHKTNISYDELMEYTGYGRPRKKRKDMCQDREDKNQKKECLNFVNYMDKIQALKKSK